MEEAEGRLERLSDEMRRVSAEGASSSSLSLQPKPVVKPTPPFSNLPSRCLVLRMGVSRESLGRPEAVVETDEMMLSGLGFVSC